jgi:hypothetical protein
MTLRHEMLVGAWRSIARYAGVATSAEPQPRHLRRDGQWNGVVDSLRYPVNLGISGLVGVQRV